MHHTALDTIAATYNAVQALAVARELAEQLASENPDVARACTAMLKRVGEGGDAENVFEILGLLAHHATT